MLPKQELGPKASVPKQELGNEGKARDLYNRLTLTELVAEQILEIRIIGIDCATKERKIGLAQGIFDGSNLRISKLEEGNPSKSIVELITRWISDEVPTLLALDAPLGWPAKLSEVLLSHCAGSPIIEKPDEIFFRLTDMVVMKEVGQHPLSVGADKIARTAHAALLLIQKLRNITKRTIPLAWGPEIRNKLSTIEVYPAATLKVCKIPNSAYKKENQEERRKEIILELGQHLSFDNDNSLAVSNADVLDAIICVLLLRAINCSHRPRRIYYQSRNGFCRMGTIK